MLKKRLDLGLEHKETASRLRVHPTSVRNCENGRCSPKLAVLPKVLEFLGNVPWEMDGLPFGGRIVAVRQVMGISQKDLAADFGVDPSTPAGWERNEQKSLR